MGGLCRVSHARRWCLALRLLSRRLRLSRSSAALPPWLAASLQRRYPDLHTVRTDAALYDHVQALKDRYLRQSPPLAKVVHEPLPVEQKPLAM